MPNNPFLDPATTVSGVRATPWPQTAPSNYTRPMHRGPGTPPHSNFTSPYAPRELLPYYVGFPSEYPHILPTETQHPYDLAFALVKPWLLPRPAPVARPAPKRAAAGGGQAKTNDQPKTPPAPPASNNTQSPISPVTYNGVNGISATGMDPLSGRNATAADLRNDPDLTMQTPDMRTGTYSGGAIAEDAVNDILNRYLETGQGAQWQPTVNALERSPARLAADNTGVGATRLAESVGLDRSGYYRDLQQRMRQAQDARYIDILRQQRGF